MLIGVVWGGIIVFGVIGYLGKGVVVGVIGVLFVVVVVM